MATSEKFINPFTDFGFKKRFEERQDYEESLKYYRDLKNVTDTAKIEGKMERDAEIVVHHYKNGHNSETIANFAVISVEKVNQIIQTYNDGLYPNLKH